MVDRRNAFCAEDSAEGARLGLLSLVTGVSEEYWAAGWLIDLEFALWDAAHGGKTQFGLGTLSERKLRLLQLLSEEAGGWWIWDGDQPRFLDLEAWRTHREANQTS